MIFWRLSIEPIQGGIEGGICCWFVICAIGILNWNFPQHFPPNKQDAQIPYLILTITHNCGGPVHAFGKGEGMLSPKIVSTFVLDQKYLRGIYCTIYSVVTNSNIRPLMLYINILNIYNIIDLVIQKRVTRTLVAWKMKTVHGACIVNPGPLAEGSSFTCTLLLHIKFFNRQLSTPEPLYHIISGSVRRMGSHTVQPSDHPYCRPRQNYTIISHQITVLLFGNWNIC